MSSASTRAHPSIVNVLHAKRTFGGMFGIARPDTRTSVSFVGSACIFSPAELTQYQFFGSSNSLPPGAPHHLAAVATAGRYFSSNVAAYCFVSRSLNARENTRTSSSRKPFSPRGSANPATPIPPDIPPTANPGVNAQPAHFDFMSTATGALPSTDTQASSPPATERMTACGFVASAGTEIRCVATMAQGLPRSVATTWAYSVSRFCPVASSTAFPSPSFAAPREAIAICAPARGSHPCRAIATSPPPFSRRLAVGPSSHAPDLSAASVAAIPPSRQNFLSLRTTPAAVPLYVH